MLTRRAILFLLLSTVPGLPALAQDTSQQEALAVMKTLNWIRGPQSVPLFDVASIDVSAGYMFLNPADAATFNRLNQNPSEGTEYLLAPEDLHWASYFRFDRDGYVRDDEKIDAAAILDSIRKGTEAGNVERRQKGWPQLTIIGWRLSPFYDNETKRLEWAINARDSDNAAVINFNTRILGRSGVTSVTLVVQPEGLETAITEFNRPLGTYTYKTSERYASFRAGDRVAEYGLAALVTGGAAAVATKTGLWKAIGVALMAGWKIAVAAFGALAAALRNLFRRRRTAADVS